MTEIQKFINDHLDVHRNTFRNKFPKEYKIIFESTSFLPEKSSLRERQYCILHNIKVVPKCKTCHTRDVKWTKNIKKGYTDFCSKECRNKNKDMINSTKQNNLKKYGVENISQFRDFKEKRTNTFLKKYGCHPSQTEKVKKRVKQTNLQRYGVTHPNQLPEYKEKIKLTNLDRYGVEYLQQSEEIKEKSRETNLCKWGKKHPSQKHIPSEIIKILLNENWLYHQHFSLKKSLSQIARELELSDMTIISRYLRKAGYQTQLYESSYLCEYYFSNNPNDKLKDSFLYLLQLTNDEEDFIKIGLTTRSIERRLKEIPYESNILFSVSLPLYSSWLIEKEIIEKFKEFKYLPEKTFGGHSECLKPECQNNIIFFIQDVLLD